MKIGLQELLVVFIVALIFIGPDKLPYYAKKLGQAFGQFRKYTEDATKDIRESIVEPLNEAQKPLREAMAPVTELEKDVRQNITSIQESLSDIGNPGRGESTQPDTAFQAPKSEPAAGEAADESSTAVSKTSEAADGISASADTSADASIPAASSTTADESPSSSGEKEKAV